MKTVVCIEIIASLCTLLGSTETYTIIIIIMIVPFELLSVNV